MSGLSKNMARTLVTWAVLLCATLTVVQCCKPGEANCNCNATGLMLTRETPQKIYRVLQTVLYYANSTWGYNSSLGIQVVVNGTVVDEYHVLVDNSKDCNHNLQLYYTVDYIYLFQELLGSKEPLPRPTNLQIVAFLDTNGHSPEEVGVVICDKARGRQCETDEIIFHFPPRSNSIHIHHYPPDIVVGQMLTITCNTTDGNPPVEIFRVRGFSQDGRHEIFHKKGMTVTISEVKEGIYWCEAYSFPQNTLAVVTSDHPLIIGQEQPPPPAGPSTVNEEAVSPKTSQEGSTESDAGLNIEEIRQASSASYHTTCLTVILLAPIAALGVANIQCDS